MYLLVEPQSGSETIVFRLSVCLFVCLSVRDDLTWDNIANSLSIVMKLHMCNIYVTSKLLED